MDCCKEGCQNANPCTCPNKDCPRFGKCCECVKHHRDNIGNTPNCYKAKEA